jgi:hypothetical protein
LSNTYAKPLKQNGSTVRFAAADHKMNIFNGLMNLALNDIGLFPHCCQSKGIAGLWNEPGLGHAMSEYPRKWTPYVFK